MDPSSIQFFAVKLLDRFAGILFGGYLDQSDRFVSTRGPVHHDIAI
jgi:hypothetical protein